MEQNKCPMCGNTLIGNDAGTTLTCTNTQCNFQMGMDVVSPIVLGVSGFKGGGTKCPSCEKEMEMVKNSLSYKEWECKHCGAKLSVKDGLCGWDTPDQSNNPDTITT
jgi:predicted RNA-binding Zn-ribbon protein involved in translation (DUF1610 family)